MPLELGLDAGCGRCAWSSTITTDGVLIAAPSCVSSTSVPSPGSLRISAFPPYLSMRPIIDSRTPRRSAGIDSGSKPGPRSSMKTRAPPFSISA